MDGRTRCTEDRDQDNKCCSPKGSSVVHRDTTDAKIKVLDFRDKVSKRRGTVDLQYPTSVQLSDLDEAWSSDPESFNKVQEIRASEEKTNHSFLSRTKCCNNHPNVLS